jgi:hypothetical protein
MNINEIDQEISRLNHLKDQVNFYGLSKLNYFERLTHIHESSSIKTDELKITYKMFKRGLKLLLTTINNTNNDINIVKWITSLGHFYISGFIELDNSKFVYFSIEDLRGGCKFMIRECKDFNDYTGGKNNYLNIDDFSVFKDDLTEFLKRVEYFGKIQRGLIKNE